MFSDIELHKELVSRKDKKTKTYLTYLNQIESNFESVIDNNKALGCVYPNKGKEHAVRIMEHINSITYSKYKKELSSIEIIILFISAIFYDSGMNQIAVGDFNKVEFRENHDTITQRIIERYFDEVLGDMTDKARIKNAIFFICEAQGFSLDELVNDVRFAKTDKIDGTLIVRYGLLAFLLRLGDLMALNTDRTINYRMMLFSPSFSSYTKKKNAFGFNIDQYNDTTDEILIRVFADDVSQYKIWSDRFSLLRNDIEKFNAHFVDTGFYFPIPDTEILKPDGARYEVQSLRFEIDEHGGMWDVISKSVYTKELDFMREIIQNAIDATLKPIFIDCDNIIDYASPRSWKMREKSIAVFYSENKNILSVTDYGIGMDLNDLRNFLFKVSGSGNVSNDTREFAFPGIAKYGIGFISCLINADQIEVYTSNNKNELYKVSLESSDNHAFIETINNDSAYVGTTVVLKLKNHYSKTEISNYLESTFKYPSIKIQYYDFDFTERVLDSIRNIKAKISFYSKPYEYEKVLLKSTQSLEKKRLPLTKAKIELQTTIEDGLDELLTYFDANTELLFELAVSEPREKYNARVQSLFSAMEKAGIKNYSDEILITDLPANHSQYTILQNRVYRAFGNNSLLITERLAYIEKQIDDLNIVKLIVNENTPPAFGEWKFIFIGLDSDLNPFGVEKDTAGFSLDKKQGILLIKQDLNNYSLGIECSVVHGFLVSKGLLCNRIARLTPHYEGHTIGENRPNSITIPINTSYEDIREELEDYITENEDFLLSEYSDEYDQSYSSVESEYEDLSLINNKISKTDGRNMAMPQLANIDNDYNHDEQDWGLNRINDVELYDYINKILLNSEEEFCQDGISIPCDLASIFPMGLFRIKCNLTANSRMKLNITRHNVSELRPDIDTWLENTGHYIQDELLDGLFDSLNKLEASAENYRDLLWPKQTGTKYFKEKAWTEFQYALGKALAKERH